jgi:3-oxoacyl-[acyl-carrier-protein] synthase-3
VSATLRLRTGSYRPERVVTNDELSRVMETDDAWIRSRVGIESRRFAAEGETLVDMATAAGRAALADAGTAAADVDAVIVATCTMPTPVPNAAARVATNLGVDGVAAYDVNAACAGFTYSLAVAADMVRAGSATTVVVVGAEKFTDWVDPTDRSTGIIFADGAGAFVVTGVTDVADAGIGPVAWGSSGEHADLISVPVGGRWLQQEGQAVFRWATTAVAPVAVDALELAGLTPADVDVLVPHQANLRILEALAKSLRKLGAREDMVLARDIVTSGNTSAGSVPMALDHLRAAGEVPAGGVALLVGFGAGLSYAAQAVLLP